MNNKLSTAKSVLVGTWCIAASLYSGASTAAVLTDTMPVARTPVSELPDASFIGGILLAGMVPSPTMSETLQLAEVAEYEHLFVTGDPTDVDLIETGAIIAGVFHSVAIPIRRLPVALRWVHIMQGILECAAPGSCTAKSMLLEQISDQTAGKTLVEKLRIVNSAVNNTIRYRSDQSLYGKLDYWATPAEILAHASGDCEDSAILKMTALMRVGIPARSLSLVVLRNNGRGVLHAVLAVTTSSGTFILDNARANVAMDSDLPYQPLYSLSDNRAWIHGTKVSDQPAAVADIGISNHRSRRGLLPLPATGSRGEYRLQQPGSRQ